MSFLGFLLTTGIKIIYGAILLFLIIKETLQIII